MGTMGEIMSDEAAAQDMEARLAKLEMQVEVLKKPLESLILPSTGCCNCCNVRENPQM